MRQSPVFTAVAVLTLAVGIGANTAIFSMIHTIMLEPLPYPESDRIVRIWETNLEKGWDSVSVSSLNYRDWRAAGGSFEEMAIYRGESFNVTGGGEPERLVGIRASAGIFRVLGREPSSGRSFLSEDDQAGAAPVAIVSHGLWQRRFGGEGSLIGKTVRLNDVPHTVIGILPEDFTFMFDAVDLFVPIALDFQEEQRGSHSYAVMGRLKGGVSLQQARDELETITTQLQKDYPRTNTGWGTKILPIYEDIFPEPVRMSIAIIFFAVVFVLLIACANVANLLLARSASREKEMAIRLAIGSNRLRIVRQLFTESIVLGLLGGGGGILFAMWAIPALVSIAPPDTPRIADVGLNSTALLYALAASLVTGVLFGMAPALQGTRSDLNEVLKEGGRSSSGRSRHVMLKVLVVSEVALAVTLLATSGLMIRSILKLNSADVGFNTKNLLTMRLALPDARYDEAEKRSLFYRQVLERLRALPGVVSASVVNTLPLGGSNSWTEVSLEGRSEEGALTIGTLVVGTDYFRTLEVPILLGRDLAERDEVASMKVAIVNESFARRYWPDGSPVGSRFKPGRPDADDAWVTIVGVAADVRHRSVQSPPRHEMYLPQAQTGAGSMTLVLRAPSDPLSLAPSVRSGIWEVDRDIPAYGVRSMEEVVRERMAGPLVTAQVMGVLAGVALLLAAVGLYGVMAYSVSERTREIGVRMALGARHRDISRLVLRQALVMLLIGLAVGLAGALGMGRVIANLVFGVTSTDPVTYASILTILALVALIASYLPARRAARVDPLDALRHE